MAAALRLRLFAGVSLEGSTLRQDNGANERLYGRAMVHSNGGPFLLLEKHLFFIGCALRRLRMFFFSNLRLR
jgi:hypothetical protein